MISLSLTLEREFIWWLCYRYVTIRRLNQWYVYTKWKVITYHFISYRRLNVSTLVEIQNTLLVSVEYEGIEKRPDGRKDNFMPLCLQKTRRKALNTERTTPIYPDGGLMSAAQVKPSWFSAHNLLRGPKTGRASAVRAERSGVKSSHCCQHSTTETFDAR